MEFTLHLKPGNPDGTGGVITGSVMAGGKEIEPNHLNELPPRIRDFVGMVKENSAYILLSTVESIEWLDKQVAMNFGHFGDVTANLSGNNILTLIYDPPPLQPDDLPLLDCMDTEGFMDGARFGMSDWHPPVEKGIRKALKAEGDWTTGWYLSCKGNGMARISKTWNGILIDVFVSDEFNIEGWARRAVPIEPEFTLEDLRAAVDSVWEDARNKQQDNIRCIDCACSTETPRKESGNRPFRVTASRTTKPH